MVTVFGLFPLVYVCPIECIFRLPPPPGGGLEEVKLLVDVDNIQLFHIHQLMLGLSVTLMIEL